MASNTPKPQAGNPLVSLTAEAKQHIVNMTAEIDRINGDLEGLKSLGFDVTQLEERLAWARKAKEVILKSFE